MGGIGLQIAGACSQYIILLELQHFAAVMPKGQVRRAPSCSISTQYDVDGERPGCGCFVPEKAGQAAQRYEQSSLRGLREHGRGSRYGATLHANLVDSICWACIPGRTSMR